MAIGVRVPPAFPDHLSNFRKFCSIFEFCCDSIRFVPKCVTVFDLYHFGTNRHIYIYIHIYIYTVTLILSLRILSH